jgi:hypothetical protein
MRRRCRPPVPPKPDHTLPRMLAWIDAYKARWGRWPTRTSGRIDGTLTETWLALDARLRRGGRGLPGGSTLAQRTASHRWCR